MLDRGLCLPLSSGEEASVPERGVVDHRVVHRVVSGSVRVTQFQLLWLSLDLSLHRLHLGRGGRTEQGRLGHGKARKRRATEQKDTEEHGKRKSRNRKSRKQKAKGTESHGTERHGTGGHGRAQEGYEWQGTKVSSQGSFLGRD
jgi:hypothetical protein